jgi:hypothetical protein
VVRCVIGALVVLALTGGGAVAQQDAGEAHFEFLLGTAWSLATPLTVRLPDAPPLRRRVKYSTHPWSDAPYYAYRAGGGSTSARDVPAGYETELLHHKLYLDDPTPPIEHFEVTHGYNLITANAVRPADRLSIRFGIGVVIAHAEGRISGQRVGGSRRTLLGGGYHVAGITAQVAAGRRYPLARGQVVMYALPEAKITASVAQVPLGDAGGSVLVPNVAAHLLAALGVRRVSP